MNTFCPGLTSSSSLNACRAVSPASGTAAAAGKSRSPCICGEILVDAGLLGECACTILRNPGEHTVTDVEPFDFAANGNDFAREFVAKHKRKLWPHDCTQLPLSELEIYRVQARRPYFNEKIARPRHRYRDIHQHRAFWTAIMLQ